MVSHVLSKGTKVEIERPVGGSVKEEIGCITSFDTPQASRDEIDVTCLQSTSKEFILGFVDNGTATFDINFDGCDDGQQEVEAALQDDDPSTITITLSDTTEIEFDAYVQSFNLTGSVGAAVTGTITVRVTGDVTFSWPSSCS